MRIRLMIAAVVLVLAGIGTSSAVATPSVEVNTSTRYACGGVDSVGGICINSPFDTVGDLLR